MKLVDHFDLYILQQTSDWTFLKVHNLLNKKRKTLKSNPTPKSCVLTMQPPLAFSEFNKLISNQKFVVK